MLKVFMAVKDSQPSMHWNNFISIPAPTMKLIMDYLANTPFAMVVLLTSWQTISPRSIQTLKPLKILALNHNIILV